MHHSGLLFVWTCSLSRQMVCQSLIEVTEARSSNCCAQASVQVDSDTTSSLCDPPTRKLFRRFANVSCRYHPSNRQSCLLSALLLSRPARRSRAASPPRVRCASTSSNARCRSRTCAHSAARFHSLARYCHELTTDCNMANATAEYENILTEVRGKVAIITLNRPKVRSLALCSARLLFATSIDSPSSQLNSWHRYSHSHVMTRTGTECALQPAHPGAQWRGARV